MAGGGDKTTTTKVELPKYLEDAAEQNIDIGNEVAAIGMPLYSGASLAGFSPQQLAAMQGADQAAAAFGMPSAVDWRAGADGSMSAPRGMDSNAMYQALTGMSAPTSSIGGQTGYSLIPFLEDALAATPAAQRAAVESFVMNPYTGEGPTNASVPQPKTKFGPNGVVGRNSTGEEKRDRLTEQQRKDLMMLSSKAYMGGSR